MLVLGRSVVVRHSAGSLAVTTVGFGRFSGSPTQMRGRCSHSTTYTVFTFQLLRRISNFAQVDVVTGYRLDGPGIEFQWGFSFATRPAPRPVMLFV